MAFAHHGRAGRLGRRGGAADLRPLRELRPLDGAGLHRGRTRPEPVDRQHRSDLAGSRLLLRPRGVPVRGAGAEPRGGLPAAVPAGLRGLLRGGLSVRPARAAPARPPVGFGHTGSGAGDARRHQTLRARHRRAGGHQRLRRRTARRHRTRARPVGLLPVPGRGTARLPGGAPPRRRTDRALADRDPRLRSGRHHPRRARDPDQDHGLRAERRARRRRRCALQPGRPIRGPRGVRTAVGDRVHHHDRRRRTRHDARRGVRRVLRRLCAAMDRRDQPVGGGHHLRRGVDPVHLRPSYGVLSLVRLGLGPLVARIPGRRHGGRASAHAAPRTARSLRVPASGVHDAGHIENREDMSG